MKIAFDVEKTCSGQAAVVESENCSTLPVVWDHAEDALTCHIYSLQGSFFNITLANVSKTRAEKPHIWITHTEEAARKLQTQLSSHDGDFYRCNNNYSDATCFLAEDFVGSSVRFNVQSPGYYCIATTSASDLSITAPVPFGIKWSFKYLSYDFEAILSQCQVVAPWKYISGKTETSVTMSSLFNFTRQNCALLRIQCVDTQDHKFTIGGFVGRWDVTVAMTCVYAMFLCVLLICVLVMCVCHKCVCNRRTVVKDSSADV